MKINQTPEEQYAALANQIKELEAQKDLLNTQIMDSMNQEGLTNSKTSAGEFLIAWRKSYEYSIWTRILEEDLKVAKKTEEGNGTAVIAKQTTYLRFLPIKQ
ncbi:MAG TPA: hypothetical protein DD730_09875 [Desulfosporosinus sp.]|jgi:hypothetical protein|nr:hypothetical protein [Desulfosporosinus sp.]